MESKFIRLAAKKSVCLQNIINYDTIVKKDICGLHYIKNYDIILKKG